MTEVKQTFTINKFWEPRTLVYETTYPVSGMYVFAGEPDSSGVANLEKVCGIVVNVDGQQVTVRFTDTPMGRIAKEAIRRGNASRLHLTIAGRADEELFFPQQLCLVSKAP